MKVLRAIFVLTFKMFLGGILIMFSKFSELIGKVFGNHKKPFQPKVYRVTKVVSTFSSIQGQTSFEEEFFSELTPEEVKQLLEEVDIETLTREISEGGLN
jgi:hypothetical protein